MLISGRFGFRSTESDDHLEKEARVVLGGGVLYCRPTSEQAAPFISLQHAPNGNVLCITGAPIHLERSDLVAAIDEIVPLDADAAASKLRNFDGGFAFLHWDARNSVLTVVTDFLGVQPLFMSRTSGVLMLSSSLAGLTRRGWISNEPDAEGWGSYLVMGYPLGNRSLLRGAKRVPAATVLRYEVSRDALHMERYWPWPEPTPQVTRENVEWDRVFEGLDRSTAAYKAYGQTGFLLLSGGLDSRMVMYLLKRHRIPAKALIVRHADEAGDADGHFAIDAAKRAGFDYELIEPAKDGFFASPQFLEYMRRTEFSSPALQLFIPRVMQAINPALGAVWEGVAPQLIRAPATLLPNFAAYSKPMFATAERILGPHAKTPFSAAWREALYEGFYRAFKDEVGRYSDDEFGLTAFVFNNRTRIRIAGNPYRAWQEEVLPFTPGLTRGYVGYGAMLSAKCKGRHEMLVDLFRRYMPDAMKTPFVSGSVLHNLTGRPNILYARARLHEWIDHHSKLSWILARLKLRPWTVDEDIPLPSAEECLEDSFLDVKGMPRDLPISAQRQLFYWERAEDFFGVAQAAGEQMPHQERAATKL